MLAFQSHFVVRNVGAYAGGIAASSIVMLLGGYPAFAILFVGAGAVRLDRRARHRGHGRARTAGRPAA